MKIQFTSHTLAKAILPLILAIFCCSNIFAQLKTTMVECDDGHIIGVEHEHDCHPDDLRKLTEEAKDNHHHPERTSQAIINLYSQIPLSRGACLNGSFENNYSGWTGLGMRHSNEVLPIENGLTANTGVQALPINSNNNLTAISTSGLDPVLAGASPSFNMQRTISGGSAIRLGNDDDGWGAEGIAKRFVVQPDQTEYYFQYALVMEESHPNSDGTTNGSEAFFIAEAIDQAGNSIDQVIDIGNSNNPFIQATNAPGWGSGSVYFRDWNCEFLDLSSHVGQEVVVYFLNSDCARGGHQGYTYLDAVCENCTGDDGYIEITQLEECIESLPHSVEGNFALPSDGNFSNPQITLQILSGGAVVNTVTGPSITGSHYTFSLNSSDFPSTNADDCYDIVTALTFTRPDLNGNPQLVTHLSSKVVNGVQDGHKDGLDNDVCFCDPCLEINNNPDFTYDIVYGASGADITIQDISTTGATSYPYFTIDFGDGNSVTLGAGSSYTHHYNSYGTYTVCLTMYAFEGNLCCHEEICKTIVIDEPDCDDLVFDFNISQNGCNVTTSYSSVYTSPGMIQWNWGDGSPWSSGATASHTYSGTGVKMITMHVTYHPVWNPDICCYKEITKYIYIGNCHATPHYPDTPNEARYIDANVVPNPAKKGSIFYLEVATENAQSVEFSLTNMLGQRFIQDQFEHDGNGLNVYGVQVPNDLAVGVYLYTIRLKDGSRKGGKMIITN